MKDSFDLIVLGAGSGGLAAAKRAASYGAKVAIIEGDRVGGTCVIRGCVPKKLLVYGSLYGHYLENASSYGVQFSGVKFDTGKLLSNVRKEVDRLNKLHIQFLSKSGVELFTGWGRFTGPNSISIRKSDDKQENLELSAKHILVAVGGQPIRPDIKGASLGWVSDDMFLQQTYPEKVIIIGGGFIACEFASILNGIGVEVTQLVRGPELLRGFDLELARSLKEGMKGNGIDLRFNTSLLGIEGKNGDMTVITNNNKYNTAGVLFAVGRKPYLKGLDIDKAGVRVMDNKIEVDQFNMTNIPGIYAIGDVTNRINLTPVAISEGRNFSDRLYANKDGFVSYQLVPKAVFSQPEIASVGLSEEEAFNKFPGQIKIYKSTFRPMSNSLSQKGGKCLMKLIVEIKSEKIIGCHMIGEHSAEIIQMASISLMMGAKKEDFDKTMALHPTLAEEFVTMK